MDRGPRSTSAINRQCSHRRSAISGGCSLFQQRAVQVGPFIACGRGAQEIPSKCCPDAPTPPIATTGECSPTWPGSRAVRRRKRVAPPIRLQAFRVQKIAREVDRDHAAFLASAAISRRSCCAARAKWRGRKNATRISALCWPPTRPKKSCRKRAKMSTIMPAGSFPQYLLAQGR